MKEKLERLKDDLCELGKLAVGFSGGVDSTFLMKVAYAVLGEKLVAVTVRSMFTSQEELDEAVGLARMLGVRHEILYLDASELRYNPVNRCYLCKRKVFAAISAFAEENGIKHIADGSNVDDDNDFRPGMAAIKELAVISPLKKAGLSKAEIRELSRQMGLSTWNKPAMACLATRIPYGQEITVQKLKMIEQAERAVRDEGIIEVRVRHHGEIARIEVSPKERKKLADERVMDRIDACLRQLGFRYVAMDMKGYRTGSMNVGLPHKGE